MTIFGLDFSHYDAVPSGARVVSEEFQFMTHKAGGDANDAELAAWWTALKPYRDKVLLGAYWVLYPGSPSSKADAFIARLDSQCPGWRDGPFILQVDCEKWNGDSSTVPNVATINTFCDRLVAKLPKLKPIAYVPDWVYGDLSALRYPTWSSKYVTATGKAASALYPGDSASQWAAYGGKTPTILQFTSSATALGQTTCDANAFKGTLNQLTAIVAPGWATTLEEDMPLTAAEITAVADAVWAKGLGAPGATDGSTWSAEGMLRNTYVEAKNGHIQDDKILPIVTSILSTSGIDYNALAAALAPALTASVMAALPQTSDPISQDEVNTAVLAAFHSAFGTAS